MTNKERAIDFLKLISFDSEMTKSSSSGTSDKP